MRLQVPLSALDQLLALPVVSGTPTGGASPALAQVPFCSPQVLPVSGALQGRTQQFSARSHLDLQLPQVRKAVAANSEPRPLGSSVLCLISKSLLTKNIPDSGFPRI